jgi:hypothetical protein
MGQFLPQSINFPLEEQIKTLADDELLDFWEETQFLGKFLEEEMFAHPESSMEYERLIIQELQLRSCQRVAPKP